MKLKTILHNVQETCVFRLIMDFFSTIRLESISNVIIPILMIDYVLLKAQG